MPDVPNSQAHPPGGLGGFRLSIRSLMATVAVVAFGCFVLVATDGGGVLLAGPLLALGFICRWHSRAGIRRFWLGFVIAGVTAILAYVGLIQLDRQLAFAWPLRVFNFGLAHFSWVDPAWDHLESGGSQAGPIILFEVSYGLPILLIAVSGGLLAAFLRPRSRVRRQVGG